MNLKDRVRAIQRALWFLPLIGAAIVVGSCMATESGTERVEIERQLLMSDAVISHFGDVYSLSSLMKRSRVRWTGEEKTGEFVYEIKGRRRVGDARVRWRQSKDAGFVEITEILVGDGQSIYRK